jgi:NAD(P)-dependent dehydrogenase (short-subunit alcohol dehydrogenase family)
MKGDTQMPDSTPAWNFGGRVVAVTGAGAGIGAACARLFAGAGATVAVVDLDAGAAGAVCREIGATTGREAAFPFAADVGEPGAMDALLAQVVERHGGLDVLVNNAGIFRTAPVIETTDESWFETVRTNLTGVFFASRAAARIMVERGKGGRIVTISSQHAAVSEPNGAPYTATKAGVEGFSRTLASELAGDGITVNCVRPGATWSKLTEPIYTPDVLSALLPRIPLGEIAQPDWIAQGVAFFASDAGRFATGTTLALDGGYIMDGSLQGVAYG